MVLLMGAMLLLIAAPALAAIVCVAYAVSRIIVDTFSRGWQLMMKTAPDPDLVRFGMRCLWIALIILLPIEGCSFMQVRIYKNNLPPPLEIDGLVYHDEESGFREGCGAGVFQLSRKTLDDIDRQGLDFFRDATRARGPQQSGYEPWRATPYVDTRDNFEKRLLRGEQCLSFPPRMWPKIRAALKHEGAYYTTGHEKDLVVIPSLGVVVFSHDG